MILHLIQELLQLVVDFVFYLIPRANIPKPVRDLPIVAHRGWHGEGRPIENTLNAFHKAFRHGIWGVELDIRWTKNLVPIVHHDPDLQRIWGIDEYISDLTYEELRQRCPLIPTLNEVVEAFKGKLHLFIELKEEVYPDILKQKEILKNTLSPLQPGEDFHLLSLYPRVFEQFNLYDPSEVYVLVSMTNTYDISKEVLKRNYKGFSGHYLLITNQILSHHKNRGQAVGTGFIRSQNCLRREIDRRVDWYFTNHPWALIGSDDLKN